MEILIGAIVVVVVLWILASRRRQEAVRRDELRTWQRVEHDPPYSRTWLVDFATMRMTYEFEVTDDPEHDAGPEKYFVERTDRGWRMKLTDESHRRALAALRELAGTAAAKAFGGERLEKLEAGNRWERMPAEAFAGLETAYQRYVRQG